MEVVKLVKFGKPTKFDQEQYGTIWESQKDDGGFYIQLAQGIGANWVPLGSFLETVYLTKLQERSWLDEALHIYHAQRVTASCVDRDPD